MTHTSGTDKSSKPNESTSSLLKTSSLHSHTVPDGISLYDLLQVDTKATRQEIRAAFRRLAAEHHPDKGGDAELFLRISEAARVLSDPALRQEYDETGTYETITRDKVLQTMLGLFREAINAGVLERIVENMKQSVTQQLKQAHERVAAEQNHIRRLGKVKIKTKKKENIFNRVLEENIDARQASIDELNHKIRMGELLLNELNLYEDDYQFHTYMAFGDDVMRWGSTS